MDRLQLMVEADKRGILPPEQKALLNEAIKRNLVVVEKPTAIERLGRGVADVTEGIGQAGRYVGEAVGALPDGTTDAYTRQKTEEIANYERGRGSDAGIDWMRLGGNVAATLPTMAIPGGAAATMGPRIAAGAAQGAAASGAMFTPEGDNKILQTAGGAILGGAMPVAVQGIKKAGGALLDWLRPAVTVSPAVAQRIEGELSFKLNQQGIDFGKLTADVRSSLVADAQKALSAGGTLDDAMLANKALIESVGAKPTTASITRNPKDWQTEMNLRGVTGVGEPIAERQQKNAAALIDYLGKLRVGTGGKASTALEAGESAIAVIKAQDEAKRKAVSNLYDAFKATGNETAQVPNVKIADAVGRVADDFGFENIPGPVQNRLKEFGFLSGGGMHGGPLEAGFKESGKLFTIKEADKLNRLINNNNPGFGPQSKALQIIKNALDESLLDVPGNGAEALIKAKSAAAQRFAEQRAGKGIAAAIEDVSPDRFVKKFIMDADVRDVRAMRDELLKSAGGTQAISDIKGHLLDNLLMKATRATNIDDVAGKPFSGVMFSKALDAIAPEKLHIIFSSSELGALRTLQKASKLLTEEVPFSDVNHSKTTAAIANLLLKIGSTPMVGKLLSPIIGAGKIGADWVKNAGERRQVAEILVGSAAKPAANVGKNLPPVSVIERVLPGAAASVSQGLND